MIIPWSDQLSIGVPEIDVEHKYLLALLNDFHDQVIAGAPQAVLTETFAHLIGYTERHFANEESLMRAIDYPELEEHQALHFDLADQASELSQQYLSGEKKIDLALLDFLKLWITQHVLVDDSKIGAFLDGQPVASVWDFTPAFSTSSDDWFKKCTFCDNTWEQLDDLLSDASIELLDQQVDAKNHYYNLFFFNCSCGTTLAIPLFDFIEAEPQNFKLEETTDRPKPDYCLRGETEACLAKCACDYASRLAQRFVVSGSHPSANPLSSP